MADSLQFLGVAVLASNTECSDSHEQDREHQNSVDRRQKIVEHDAEPAMDPMVGPPYRPWLPDVEEPEEQEGSRIRQGVERRRQQHQPLRCDLVDHDRAGVIHTARLGDRPCCPTTDGKYDHRGDRQPRRAR